MTTLEILATIFAILILVKIITVVINLQAWMKLVKPIYMNGAVSTVVSLILAGVTGYYVFATLSIIEVGAVMLFLVFLLGIGIFPYGNSLFKLGDELLKHGIKKAWLSLAIWVAFALWILYSVFLGT